MKDEIFIDSNILIYSVSQNLSKCQTSRELLLKHVDRITVSSQVINEFINVCIKKSILDLSGTFEKSNEFMEIFRFAVITKSDIRLAMDIKKRYRFSYWDSLIIASALENNCSILYSEDMQHSQVIEDDLKIINPFEMG
ncbi:MAG: PIN domain-containing protein [Deltaproteobacteria bacterium]|nr:PIN domain-containing protein [Deltaproteobacteria bacterium]MBW2167450.1 PIN domain-containing protein [Deltaproteobacteria bacterium]